MQQKSTTRFSNRVEDYVKYRPGYPKDIITLLENRYRLSPGDFIADIGSGTGISSALFLDAGYKVAGVEPNREMRDKSIGLLGDNPAFTAIDGTAEHTTLADKCAAAIVAGQAFHWFDRKAARKEFARILKPGGTVALIWNERLTATEFEQEYDRLITTHAIDYVQVDHRNINLEKISEFFSPAHVHLDSFPNSQAFDFDGLKGRLRSSSYIPSQDDPRYPAMLADLEALFKKHQENSYVHIHYETKVFSGNW